MALIFIQIFVFAASKQMIQLWAILLQSCSLLFFHPAIRQRSLWPETMAALAWRISALICRHFQLTCIPMHHLLKQFRSRVRSLVVSKEIRQYLTVRPDTYAIYTCSARFTYHISQCIRQLGIQDRIQVIGNDLFTESRQALSDGILRGVIDKKNLQAKRSCRKDPV